MENSEQISACEQYVKMCKEELKAFRDGKGYILLFSCPGRNLKGVRRTMKTIRIEEMIEQERKLSERDGEKGKFKREELSVSVTIMDGSIRPGHLPETWEEMNLDCQRAFLTGLILGWYEEERQRGEPSRIEVGGEVIYGE